MDNNLFKNNIILAPLAGYTDAGFRRICADFGAGLTTTEMVSAKGLHYGNENTEYLLTTCGETPVSVQIFGSDPEIMAEACKNKKLQNFDAIDINMGCPVPKIVKNGEGSALLKDPKLAEKIISACVKATNKPISVKFRLGFEKNEDTTVDFAKMCEGAGASFIVIHGRTREEYYTGSARYDTIFKTADCVKIPVFANGDIVTKNDYDFIMQNSNCFGVSIGRASLGNPFVFNDFKSPTQEELKSAILKHYEYLKLCFSEHYIFSNFKKHLCAYIGTCKNARAFRDLIFKAENIEQSIAYAIEAVMQE